MDPKETLKHIAELCEDAKNKPQYLTFLTIHEWCEKQMESYGFKDGEWRAIY
jgi:hypothetical protein